MKIRPLADRVVLKWVEAQNQTDSWIFIPESTKQQRPFIYEVVAVWPGTSDKKMYINVGQKVLCGQYAGDEVKHEDIDYKIVAQEYILAVIED